MSVIISLLSSVHPSSIFCSIFSVSSVGSYSTVVLFHYFSDSCGQLVSNCHTITLHNLLFEWSLHKSKLNHHILLICLVLNCLLLLYLYSALVQLLTCLSYLIALSWVLSKFNNNCQLDVICHRFLITMLIK